MGKSLKTILVCWIICCISLYVSLTEGYPNTRPERSRRYNYSNRATSDDGKIIFPTEEPELDDNFLGSVPICKGSTFCESSPNYPEEFVEAALRSSTGLRYLSGVDIVADIAQRIDASEDSPLCTASERLVYPKSAETKEKEWLYVVNGPNFTQGIRIEECGNENNACNLIDGFAAGYKTICKQKYIYRQLVAISPNGIGPETFRFPASCCCHIIFTGNPENRMGIVTNFGRETSPISASTSMVRNSQNVRREKIKHS